MEKTPANLVHDTGRENIGPWGANKVFDELIFSNLFVCWANAISGAQYAYGIHLNILHSGLQEDKQ